MAGRWRSEWMVALAASLALHGAALWLWLWQPSRPVHAAGPAKTWRVQLRARSVPAAAPMPAPAPVMQPPRPEPPRAPRQPQPRAAPEDAPAAATDTAALEPPAPQTPPDEAPAPATSRAPLWLDAGQADQAPAPLDNVWLLDEEVPWPAAFPLVEVRLWITADGRIERFALQGAAADDPALQRLFAPFAGTPMRPAYIGNVPVPSTMRIQLWPGDGPAPDFIAPLPPASR